VCFGNRDGRATGRNKESGMQDFISNGDGLVMDLSVMLNSKHQRVHEK